MPSTFEDLGGEETLSAAVDDLFERVTADPLLQLYFDGRDTDKIKSGFKSYVAGLLGAKEEFSGPTLHEIHRGTEINDMGFDVFVELFLDALGKQKVSKDHVEAVKEKLLPLKNEVVDSFVWRGDHFYDAR